jgi:hypothetical protein
MIHFNWSVLLFVGFANIHTGQLLPVAEGPEAKDPSPFAVEKRVTETPFRTEQDCPTPDQSDVIKGASWNWPRSRAGNGNPIPAIPARHPGLLHPE